jgi:hypothetical protein
VSRSSCWLLDYGGGDVSVSDRSGVGYQCDGN